MRERGDMFEKLEEEKVKLEEQLKWKNEQFKHLEEAHEKLRSKLCAKEKEWDMERCSFFDDISTLETKLDSHITLSEDLKSRLELALAHEQDQRKCLEIQHSESNSCVLDTKSKLESLTIEKECVCNEIECKIREMEEENQELLQSKDTSLKEITKEVDDYSSLVLQLTIEKEEFALMVVALKSTLLETKSKVDDEKL
ncbi:hypothetical protein L1987_48434 [Smallanthus sonchifolius]|uniref:Uncharacterized protein n=1 Tax=Smallanthus sonchifolius TaxID=185202 RepID=A0ACB9FRZ0_9ASTR|nr:hypothetical protein L1987_48434 [Smallanthus sonchifolius]